MNTLVLILALVLTPGLEAQTAVVTRNVNLRTRPSSSHAIIRLLHPPDELSWYSIRNRRPRPSDSLWR